MFRTEAQTELDDLKVVAIKSGGRLKYIDRSPWKAVRLANLNDCAAQPRQSANFARLAIGTKPATIAYRV